MPILNTLITRALPIIPKVIVGQVAKRYIAGVRLSDGIHAVRGLNEKGMMATMDLLGEDVNTAAESDEVRKGILSILGAIQENNLMSNVSVKPTQLGLNIDKNLALQNIRAVVEEARKLGNFVRIDMEDATTTEETLAIHRTLQSEGFTNTGVVLQSYMRRSESDVRTLVKEKTNIRLCKGIYNESSTIAYKGRREIQENYLKLLRIILENGTYVGIATHDDILIDGALKMIQEFKLANDQYEFQMLLGVRDHRRNEIVSEGHRLRVYVPFGERWYAYSTRRLKENPQMAWYITKAIFVH